MTYFCTLRPDGSLRRGFSFMRGYPQTQDILSVCAFCLLTAYPFAHNIRLTEAGHHCTETTQMVKHFRSKSSAEADLFAHGFKRFNSSRWVKTGFRATIHGVTGSMAVAVVIEELAVAQVPA